MQQWSPKAILPRPSVPEELSRVMLERARLICDATLTPFRERDFSILGSETEKAFRMCITSFETFKALRGLLRHPDFKDEFQVQIAETCYLVQVIPSPTDFMNAKQLS